MADADASKPREHEPEPKNLAPKEKVALDPPKDDPMTVAELAKCDGKGNRVPYVGFCFF